MHTNRMVNTELQAGYRKLFFINDSFKQAFFLEKERTNKYLSIEPGQMQTNRMVNSRPAT